MKKEKESEIKNKKILKAIDLMANTNITPYKIAQETGITQASLGNYKSGKTKPTLVNAEAIINFFSENQDMASSNTPINPNGKSIPYEIIQALMDERKRSDEKEAVLIENNKILVDNNKRLVDMLEDDRNEAKKTPALTPKDVDIEETTLLQGS